MGNLDYSRFMASNNLMSFAIHADDVARCRAFYEAVFGWSFEPWGPPGFYLVHTGDAENPGIQGLLHQRMEPRGDGGPNCFECTIAVEDIDSVTEAIAKHGGQVVMNRAPIPSVGVLTKFKDTEGNTVGAMRYEYARR